NSSHFRPFSALFFTLSFEGCTRAKRISFPFNRLRTLCVFTRDGIGFQGLYLQTLSRTKTVSEVSSLPLSPVQSALAGQFRVLAEIGRSGLPASALESALTDTAQDNSFRIRTYRKLGGGGRSALLVHHFSCHQRQLALQVLQVRHRDAVQVAIPH